jgi:hypothetical protein
MLSDRTRLRLIHFLLRKSDFLLVIDTPYVDESHEGLVTETVSSIPEGAEYLSEVLVSCMEHRPKVTDVILDAALGHLKRYEVDCKNFIQKLYEK